MVHRGEILRVKKIKPLKAYGTPVLVPEVWCNRIEQGSSYGDPEGTHSRERLLIYNELNRNITYNNVGLGSIQTKENLLLSLLY